MPIKPKKAVSKEPRRITQWSFSRLRMYEECPAKASYSVLDRLKSPDSPAMARGTQIHSMAEDFVKDKLKELPTELESFRAEYYALRKAARAGKAQAEDEMAFTQEWLPTGWMEKDTWCRVKVDAHLILPRERKLRIIDYKTGKMYEDSKDQLKLYALAAFRTFDDLKSVSAELWYLDLGQQVTLGFEKGQMLDLMRYWNERSRPLLNDTIFAPKPSPRCRWCPYSKSNGGPCRY